MIPLQNEGNSQTGNLRRKRAIVIGGTGFIGFHIVNALLENGFEVTLVSRSQKSNLAFDGHITFVKTDMLALDIKQWENLFDRQDFVVFATGADDREIPAKPATGHFFKFNVNTIDKICQAAKAKGVKDLIILGSYFSWLARNKPELELENKHPYVRSRIEQSRTALKYADEQFKVIVLDLPYVFGIYPGKKPMWKPLIKYVNSGLPFLFYTKGGTAAVSVRQVAKSVVLAVANSVPFGAYPIADYNFTWKEMLGMMSNKSQPGIVEVPIAMQRFFARFYGFYLNLKGKESGLKPVEFLEIQNSEIFIPEEELMPGFQPDEVALKQALAETVESCLG